MQKTLKNMFNTYCDMLGVKRKRSTLRTNLLTGMSTGIGLSIFSNYVYSAIENINFNFDLVSILGITTFIYALDLYTTDQHKYNSKNPPPKR